MPEFKIVKNNKGLITHIETSLQGYDLLATAKLNKGCAFNEEERRLFHLDGLLPSQVETLEQQVARMYVQYNEQPSNLGKNIYLNVLHDYNETLFYQLVDQYLEEMLPIIYTPTVGEAVQRFSLQHRRTRGLYLSYPERNNIEKILDNSLPTAADLTVVTDGEGVLGLGDQGIGGINISIAKLMVYTICAGINPFRVLPIQLDVGTNNPALLTDPMYLGWRHERITGQKYDDFIDAFVTAVTKKFPHILVHWEDFGRSNARRILSTYRNNICTINGDIQTTGTVALACVLAGITASGINLKQHQCVIFGAGTAGVGIADQLCNAMQRDGMSAHEARSHIWLVDKPGLLMQDTPNLMPFQSIYAVDRAKIKDWEMTNTNPSLLDVIKNVKPTILVGCSTVSNAFNEEIVKTMAAQTPLPIILPLSNPTSLSEANPEDLLRWTEGRAIIATGSPFHNVCYQNQMVRIAQSNNAFAFPGIGLGAIAVKAKYISDDMLWVAAKTLNELSPVHLNPRAPLLPKLTEIHGISRQIAFAVALQARHEGLAQTDHDTALDCLINQACWEPRYYPYKKV